MVSRTTRIFWGIQEGKLYLLLLVLVLMDRLEKGDVQWMTAGRGMMHSEIPYWDPDPAKAVAPEGMQLWVDLPKDQKFGEPSYQEKKAKE